MSLKRTCTVLSFTALEGGNRMNYGVKRITAIGLFMIFIATFSSGTVYAQDLSDLTVEFGTICENVVNHEVVAASTSFQSSIGKLYCFTKIIGAKEPTQISHVWYYGETERARIELAVKSASWRTYSSKLIQPHETGTWHVDVLDSDGRILETYRFDMYQ